MSINKNALKVCCKSEIDFVCGLVSSVVDCWDALFCPSSKTKFSTVSAFDDLSLLLVSLFGIFSTLDLEATTATTTLSTRSFAIQSFIVEIASCIYWFSNLLRLRTTGTFHFLRNSNISFKKKGFISQFSSQLFFLPSGYIFLAYRIVCIATSKNSQNISFCCSLLKLSRDSWIGASISITVLKWHPINSKLLLCQPVDSCWTRCWMKFVLKQKIPVEGRCYCMFLQWLLFSQNVRSGLDTFIDFYCETESGIGIFICKHKIPLCSCSIIVPTVPINDKGLPHTLEHLVFLGSKNIPFRGFLDVMASRCISLGTDGKEEKILFEKKRNLLFCYHIIQSNFKLKTKFKMNE